MGKCSQQIFNRGLESNSGTSGRLLLFKAFMGVLPSGGCPVGRLGLSTVDLLTAVRWAACFLHVCDTLSCQRKKNMRPADHEPKLLLKLWAKINHSSLVYYVKYFVTVIDSRWKWWWIQRFPVAGFPLFPLFYLRLLTQPTRHLLLFVI